MCINLKTFNESFRAWNDKGEEGQFWWLEEKENNDTSSIPTEAISSPTVVADLHDHRTHP